MEDALPVSLRLESCLPLPNTRFSSYFAKECFYRLLLILVALSLSVFLVAFFLQWQSTTAYLIDWRSIDQNKVRLVGVPISGQPPAQVNSSLSSNVEAAKVLNQSFHALQDLNRWNFNHNVSNNAEVKICITSTTSAGLNRLLPWILYHKVIGIDSFFLFVEGEAASPGSSKVLKSIPGVHAIARTAELEEQQAKSRIWNDTRMTIFANKPCNHKLFLKQILNMEMAILMARDAGMEWIFHLDTDELLHPAGTREYSMVELLVKLPKDVDTVVFHNYEAAVERDDIKDPFIEVSMFKKNLGHLPSEMDSELYQESFRNNPYFFMAYGNGKSGARIEDDLSPNGAHRWEYDNKTPREVTMDEAAILHYTYSRFSDLALRRDRCDCKPTVEDTEKCFFLDFDRTAFIVASNSTEPEMHQWYMENVVWGDVDLKLKLLKAGILTRIYTPLVIIRTLVQSDFFATAISTTNATTLPGTVDTSTINNTSRKLVTELP